MTVMAAPTGTHWRALLLLEAARGWSDRLEALRLVPAATEWDLEQLELLLATGQRQRAEDEAHRIAAWRPS